MNIIVASFGKNFAPLTIYKAISSNQTGACLPERVSNPIMKIDKVFLVDFQQVAAVEIEISFHKHVSESFLFRLLLVSSVTNKRRLDGDFPNQQSRLTCKIISFILY